MNVVINPAPMWVIDHYHQFNSFKFIPQQVGVFPGTAGKPTQAQLKLALALWRALDPISQRWYVAWPHRGFYWVPLSDEDFNRAQIPEVDRVQFRECQSKFGNKAASI